MEIALQLWSIANETQKDYQGSIARVGKTGFYGVEFAGYGGLSASDMKALLDENNLKSVGTHSGLQIFEEAFDEELEYNHKLGTEYIICPYAIVDTMEQIDHLVKVLNAAADKAAKYGIKVGYHNHAHEFVMIEGKYAQDWIAEKTSDQVILELDVFWLAYAGVDPVSYINQWGKKVEIIHMKQMNAEKSNVDMPDGIIDMTKIKEAARFAKHFILEHEEYDKPVWDSIQNDFNYLNTI